jgi:hypothetical protein
MEGAGVLFPKAADGSRPTTALNCGAFAAAVRASDPAAADACLADKPKWRRRYAKHVVAHVEVCARTADTAVRVARDGLTYLHSTMRFERNGQEMSVADAMQKFTAPAFVTSTVRGEMHGTPSQSPPSAALTVPYKGKLLAGDALRAQIERWVCSGE